MARLLLLGLLVCQALGAAPLINEEYGFRAEVPDSLPPVRVDSGRFPNTLHMFVEQERGGAVLQFMLLPDELAQGAVEAAGPRDASVNWKGHTLVRRQRALSPGTAHAAVEIHVDVPVAGRGIRIALTGAARRETELVGLFMSVLERFDARSNWKLQGDSTGPSLPPPPPAAGPAEPAEADGVSTTTAALALMAALIAGFAAGWWIRGLGAEQPPPVQAVPIGLKVEPPKPPPPKENPEPPKAAVVKRAPDETDPGVAEVRCRTCGETVREGRKKCMSCGAEVF